MKAWKQRHLYRMAVLAVALPLAAVSLGFDTLEEPDYFLDSNGPTSNVQNLPYLERNVERGLASETRAPAAANTSAGGDTQGLDPAGAGEVSPEQAEKYGVQEFGIIVTDKGYFPNKVIVRRNIPVNLYLTATDSQNLCFVMKKGEHNFHRGIGPKRVEKISFKPTEPGPIDFHCPIHHIKGSLIVRD